MAINHLDALAEELIELGIFKDAVKVEPGVWTGVIDLSRVLNTDETPQHINYTVDGTSRNFFYAGKGEECNQWIKENRECVSIDPTVTLAGDIAQCHLIFGGSCLSSQMAPEEAVNKIYHLLVSTTKSSYQTGDSYLASLRMLDEYITEKKIQRPVVLLTDGHSSRFSVEVLTFCRKRQIHQFVSPPDTTSVTQLLDQINQSLHSAYRKELEERLTDRSINREDFVLILADVWNSWTTKESIIAAGKRVGI